GIEPLRSGANGRAGGPGQDAQERAGEDDKRAGLHAAPPRGTSWFGFPAPASLGSYSGTFNDSLVMPPRRRSLRGGRHRARRRPGPRSELYRVLDNVKRHLVIAAEGLLRTRPEGFHPALDIGWARRWVGSEVEPALEHDREERLT